VEFGTSTIYSVRVQEMQHLGYFWDGVGKALGAEEVLEPEGELVFFVVFFTVDFACLCISLWSKCCGASKFRFTILRRTP
jgi:hypothetical protein